MQLDGIGAFVTGGASGLGEATARLLKARGARVCIYDLPRSEGARVAASALRQRGAADPEQVADAYALEALALQDLGRADDATRLLRELVSRYPTTAAARAALSDRPDLAQPLPAPAPEGDNAP